MEGRRIDYVRAAGYEFLDGRGQWTEHGRLGAQGSVARRDRGDIIELIDIYGNDRIALQATGAGTVNAYDWEGKLLGEVDLASPRADWHEFTPVSGARSYVFAPAD